MMKQYMELDDLAKMFGISREAISKWIRKGKVDEDYYVKVISPGRQGYKYLLDPRGAPKPYRFKPVRNRTCLMRKLMRTIKVCLKRAWGF